MITWGCEHFATSFRLLGPDAANVVDDIPDLLFVELLFVSQHVSRHAVADDDEDFAVCRTVIPDVVGQVGGLAAGERQAAVAFAVGTMTRSAIALIKFLSRFYCFSVLRLRILELLRFRVAARFLRMRGQPESGHDRNAQDQRRPPARYDPAIPEGHRNSPSDIRGAARADAETVRAPG